ncbi:pentapeptide repeat-containing protein [Streptomyces sp. NPDC002889]|uniref:pentapeptide repeat-containing protein n=1 Tax=Streptomyces sp. NPDC002889 TaxID=3364669 RepID=UPI0036743886
MVGTTLIPGLTAAGALIFTANSIQQAQESIRQGQESLEVARQGQVTDRYNDAVANLGSESIDVRIGGIFALQRIMADSPRDQPAVIRILGSYIRVHSPGSGKAQKMPDERPVDAPDTAAALDVLRTRDAAKDHDAYLNLRKTDLRGWWALPRDGKEASEPVPFAGAYRKARFDGANLSEANLRGADLREAVFKGTNLTRAVLVAADLRDVNFPDADLSQADLQGANLNTAEFLSTNLRGTSLQGADLKHASLFGADLKGADLRWADLSGAYLDKAKNLTVEQLLEARITHKTRLPDYLAGDPRIHMEDTDEDG